MQVLIVGDSHTGALKRGHDLMVQDGTAPDGITWRIQPLGPGKRMNTPFWKKAGDHAVITDLQYGKMMPKLPPDDPRPDAIGLSMPMWNGRIMRMILQSGYVVHGLPGQGHVMSRALLRHMVLSDMKYIMALGAYLGELGYAVFAIEPPTLFRHWSYVRPFGAETCLALQGEVRAIQRACVDEAGMPVIELPEGCILEDGFMDPQHRSEDPTDTHHVNAEFGALMLKRAVPYLRRIATAPASRNAVG